MEENNILLWSEKVLKSRFQFESIRKSGSKVFSDRTLMWRCIRNQKNFNRYGWTVPRWVGHAAFRNKVKRWSREFFRKFDKINPELGVDINVLFYSKEEKIRYKMFEKSMDKAKTAFLRSLS